MQYNHAEAGHLYLIGVGPGAPDLLTLRAVQILSTVDVIVAPRSRISNDSLALATVRPHLRNAEVIEHIYAMERNAEQTAQSWRTMADLTCDRIARGQSVAHITIGDPLIYSTCSYLVDQLDGRIPADHIHVLSGISAWQAPSALVGETLMTQNDKLTLLPADRLDAVEEALKHSETVVIYKIGPRINGLIDLLKRMDLIDRARLVCYAEQEKQRIYLNLAEAHDERLGYMSTMIVRVGMKGWD